MTFLVIQFIFIWKLKQCRYLPTVNSLFFDKFDLYFRKKFTMKFTIDLV